MNGLKLVRRTATGAAAAMLAFAFATCTEQLPDAPGLAATTALTLSLRSAVAGTASDAFDKADAAHVHLATGTAVLMDSVVPFDGRTGTLTLSVPLPGPSSAISLVLELTSHGQALFRGAGSGQLGRGATTSLTVSVEPVIAALVAPDSLPPITALGDTVRLRGAAVFATGDTVTGVPISWAGDGGTVIRVTADGLVTALREGQAQVIASAQGITHTTRIRVQAVVARVTVSPDTLSLTVGSTGTLAAVARDRSGNVLQRTVAWRSSDTGVARVDANGVVTGVAGGSATITATTEGQSGTATVWVAQPILAVSATQIRFTVTEGSGSSSFAVAVSNAGSGTLSGLTASVSYGGGSSGWLTAGLSSTTAPSTLRLTVDPGGLSAGTYSATVTVASTVPGAGTAQVSVTLEVQPPQPIVGVSATAVTLTMAYDSTLGYSARDASVTVFNAGSGTLTGLSTTVSYPSASRCILPTGWLTANVSSTTAPATLELTAIGYVYVGTPSCTATVTITSSVPGAGQATVNVTYDPGGALGSVPSSPARVP